MPDQGVAELLARYRLGVPRSPPRGVAGERLGRGTGSSLEFQDRRAYTPGDDLRHLDWRAYARTDQLMVRLYREEIAPRVEILLDGSRSMAVDDEKAAFARQLVALLVALARAESFPVSVVRMGAHAEVVPVERVLDDPESISFDGDRPLNDGIAEGRELLRRGALRLCVSDFLFPVDAADIVRPLARDAGGLALLQVLGSMDEAPPVGAALRLVDAERGTSLDMVLDARAVEGYRRRLHELSESYAEEARRAAAPFVPMSVSLGLRAACDQRLVRAGVLVPR